MPKLEALAPSARRGRAGFCLVFCITALSAGITAACGGAATQPHADASGGRAGTAGTTVTSSAGSVNGGSIEMGGEAGAVGGRSGATNANEAPPVASYWQVGDEGDSGAVAVGIDADEHVYVAGSATSMASGATSDDFEVFVRKYDESGGVLWAKQWGNDRYNRMADMAVDSAGHFFVVYAAADPSNMKSQRSYLGKYDPSGRVLWERGSETNSGAKVEVDASGGVYVVGSILGASLTEPPLYLSRYDATGALQWLTPFARQFVVTVSNLALDSSGNIYVTSNTRATSASGDTDASESRLYKFDGAGKVVWELKLGTPPREAFAGVAVDRSGDLFVAATTAAEASDGTLGPHRVLLRKYDSSGNLSWSREVGNSIRAVEFGSLRLDQDGNPHLAAYSGGLLESAAPAGAYVAAIRKYDTDGAVRWTEQCSFADRGCRLDAIAIAASGNVYGAGLTYASAGEDYSTLVAKLAVR